MLTEPLQEVVMRFAPALALLVPAVASAFPSSDGLWQPLTRGSALVEDFADDYGGGFDGIDLFGLDPEAAGYWSADAAALYLRLRLAGDPTFNDILMPGSTWAFLLDLDYDSGAPTDADWEVQVLVTGSGGDVTLFQNTENTPGTNLPISDQEGVDTSGGSPFWGELDDGVRVVNDTTTSTWLLDITLDRAELASQLGVGPTTRIRVALATGDGFLGPRLDTARCVDDTDDCSVLEPLLAKAFSIDTDIDGLTDPEEWHLGTLADDADTDDDGIPDGAEATGVSDDGLLPALDCDSDGDGILDGTEAGLTAPTGDTDIDSPCWAPDADQDTTTQPLVRDTDAGGIPDGVEDHNHDGLYDPTCFETDPNDPDDDVDTDSDGVADVLEARGADGEIDDVDSDGDGISDAIEGVADPDGDCVPAFLDGDSDGDGLPDEVEGGGDTDGDGTIDSLDPDSDGDGRPDAEEGDDDIDCDGVPDWQDADDFDGDCDDPEVDTGEFSDDPTGDVGPFAGGYFSGGACAVLPGRAAWPALLLVLGALVLRRRRWAAAGMLLAPVAQAQEVNAQRFAPSVDGVRFLTVEDASSDYRPTWGAGLFANYADDPLVFRTPDDGGELDVLAGVFTSDLLGFVNVGPARLGFDLPVHWYTDAYGIDAPVHPGDLRLSSKVYGDLDALPFDVAGFADLTLPTGAAAAFVGDARPTATMGLAASRDLGTLVAAANVGFRTGRGASVGSLDLAPAVPWRAGVSWQATDAVWASAELNGELWFTLHRGASPVEALASGRFRAGDVLVSLGAGTGLTRGVGAPDFRVLAGVQWSPAPEAAAVADQPVEPPPARALGRLVVRALRPSGDPIAAAQVRVLGTLGVPMKTGADGILEAELGVGPQEVSVAADGWIPETRRVEISADKPVDLWVVLRPEQVVIDSEARQIYLNRKVFFELDKAELKVGSLATLDTLVAALVAHPEVERLRIEGHTDTQGTDAYNQGLSEQRAQAVLDYLLRSGVAPERLESVGYGESRPLQQGESDDVHATNRRVEFHIVTLSGD